jgi:hypothetical protein
MGESSILWLTLPITVFSCILHKWYLAINLFHFPVSTTICRGDLYSYSEYIWSPTLLYSCFCILFPILSGGISFWCFHPARKRSSFVYLSQQLLSWIPYINALVKFELIRVALPAMDIAPLSKCLTFSYSFLWEQSSRLPAIYYD